MQQQCCQSNRPLLFANLDWNQACASRVALLLVLPCDSSVDVDMWTAVDSFNPQVLSPHLNLDTILKARAVCQAWRSSWSKQVPGLMLYQPISTVAA